MGNPDRPIFFLQDPTDYDDDNVSVDKLEGKEAIMGIVKRSFVLDVTDIHAAARQFEVIGKLLAAGLVLYKLQYPRRYSSLQDVRRAILDTLGATE